MIDIVVVIVINMNVIECHLLYTILTNSWLLDWIDCSRKGGRERECVVVAVLVGMLSFVCLCLSRIE